MRPRAKSDDDAPARPSAADRLGDIAALIIGAALWLAILSPYLG